MNIRMTVRYDGVSADQVHYFSSTRSLSYWNDSIGQAQKHFVLDTPGSSLRINLEKIRFILFEEVK